MILPDRAERKKGYGLSIRDCAGQHKTLLLRDTKMSAIDVTAKTIFERLVLVPGQCKFFVFCHHTLGTHTLTADDATIFWFSCLLLDFFPESPLKFCISTIRQGIWPSPRASEIRDYVVQPIAFGVSICRSHQISFSNPESFQIFNF